MERKRKDIGGWRVGKCRMERRRKDSVGWRGEGRIVWDGEDNAKYVKHLQKISKKVSLGQKWWTFMPLIKITLIFCLSCYESFR